MQATPSNFCLCRQAVHSWVFQLGIINKTVAPKLVKQQHLPSTTPITWAYLTLWNLVFNEHIIHFWIILIKQYHIRKSAVLLSFSSAQVFTTLPIFPTTTQAWVWVSLRLFNSYTLFSAFSLLCGYFSCLVCCHHSIQWHCHLISNSWCQKLWFAESWYSFCS